MVLRIRRAQPGTSSGSRTPRRRGLTGDASDPPHAHTTRGASAYAIIRLFSDRSRDARILTGLGGWAAESPRALPVRAGAAFVVAPSFDEGDGRKERRWTAIFTADGVPKCRSIACNQRNRLDDFAELVSGSGGSTHYYT